MKSNKNEEGFMTDYEKIYSMLKKSTNDYLDLKKNGTLVNFILEKESKYKKYNKHENNNFLNQNIEKKDKQEFKNRFLEIPNTDIKEAIRNSYLAIDYLSGEIGTGDGTQQFDGITNMTLLMLMSNRLSKQYQFIERKEDDQDKIKYYQEKKRECLVWKDMATTDLIASLYIINETEKEYKDTFSYGKRQDINGNETIAIDLPFFGQICVHAGRKMNIIIRNAEKKAQSILQKKCEIGEITEEQKKEAIKKIKDGNILPNYEGILYDVIAGIPMDYEGPKLKSYKEKLGIKGKLPEEITTEDIDKICKSNLNSREKYSLGIKLGFHKDQLMQIKDYNEREKKEQQEKENNKINIKEIGKKAVQETTAEERDNVKQHEKNLSNELKNEKSR